MSKKGKVVHYTEVESKLFGESAPGTSIRWLIDKENDGAPTYALRMIEVEPGGNTPQHTHPYEHENFIIEGCGKVLINDIWYELKPGCVALVPADILHQYVNTGKTVFKFLCGVPV
ncbi:MAG: cupin domain-containing protein [Anaerolineaceae bacterium]|nr:cupin domain-containing protein [Anaerolineaceae bacterium]